MVLQQAPRNKIVFSEINVLKNYFGSIKYGIFHVFMRDEGLLHKVYSWQT